MSSVYSIKSVSLFDSLHYTWQTMSIVYAQGLKGILRSKLFCDLAAIVYRRCITHQQTRRCLLLLQLNDSKQKHAASLNEVITVNIVLYVACK